MCFKIKICGVLIEIFHSYGFIRSLCADYIITDGLAPDFSVSVTADDIAAEKAASDEPFSDAVFEATCIHREIVKKLVRYGVILMHSAVISVDGTAYVFMAKSGVGKSTHIALWQRLFGERAAVVNGDKPFFTFADGVLTANGSPWRGKEGLGSDISAQVGGICFLERGEVNSIRRATSAEIVKRLFHQVLLPDDAENLNIFMSFLNRIAATVPFYVLQCNMDIDAAQVAFEGMRKDNFQ